MVRPEPKSVAVCVDCLHCAGRPLPALDRTAEHERRQCDVCGGSRWGPHVVRMSLFALLYGGRQTLPSVPLEEVLRPAP